MVSGTIALGPSPTGCVAADWLVLALLCFGVMIAAVVLA